MGGGDRTLYAISDGAATGIQAENVNGDKVFGLSRGGEILLTRLKEASKDATLQSISVNGKAIQSFKPDRYSYTVKVDPGEDNLTITAVASDPVATVTILQAVSVPGKAIITVTAQDKTAEPLVYTVSLQYNKEEQSSGAPIFGSGDRTSNSSLLALGSTEEQPAASRFTDIIGHWAEQDINEMARRGIVSGVTEMTFEPDRSITRAEFAALLTRALKLSASSGDTVFADVPSDAWYASEVAAASAVGLVAGYDGMFRPDDRITREEMAVMIMNAYAFMGKTPRTGKIDQFTDRVDISQWALAYADQAVSTGLISGMEAGVFAPREGATRAQATSILRRLLDK